MNIESMEEAISYIGSGGCICFVGSGFSVDALDSNNKNLPTARDLSKELCLLSGVDDSGANLSDLAEYCQSDSLLAPQLKELLMERLTNSSEVVLFF